MGESNILSGRVGYELKRVQNSLRGRMDGELRGLGLTTPQYAAMSVLRDYPGISGAELARRSFVTAQTMNQILANLEKRDLLEKRRHPGHGRVLQTYLTPEGENLAGRAHGVVEEIEERMLERLDKEERERLLETLRGCAYSLAHDAESG